MAIGFVLLVLPMTGTSSAQTTDQNPTKTGQRAPKLDPSHPAWHDAKKAKKAKQHQVPDEGRDKPRSNPVPEPLTLILFGVGLLLIALYSRKRHGHDRKVRAGSRGAD